MKRNINHPPKYCDKNGFRKNTHHIICIYIQFILSRKSFVAGLFFFYFYDDISPLCGAPFVGHRISIYSFLFPPRKKAQIGWWCDHIQLDNITFLYLCAQMLSLDGVCVCVICDSRKWPNQADDSTHFQLAVCGVNVLGML